MMGSEPKSRVFLEAFSSMNPERMETILGSLGLMSDLKGAKSIVLKPNLAAGTAKTPDTGTVTNPDILEFLVQFLLTANPSAEILIVESDSIGLGLAPQKFRFQGYYERFGRYDRVRIVDLSRSMIAAYPCAGEFFKQGVVLPEIVVESDLFVSVGKIKTHTNTVVTGALKNQFGCLPDNDKDKYHPYLPAVIADVNSVIRPDLCIVEGCPAMEGPGPVNGRPKPMDLLIIGKDPVAVDSTMARIMGFAPENIQMLRVAKDAGLGVLSEQDIEVYGIPLDKAMSKFDFIGREHRFYVALGFGIQRIGHTIDKIGHLIHIVESTKWGVSKAIKRLRKKPK